MNSPLFTSTPRQQQIGIAALRIILGIVMTAHGYQKLFTMGIAGVQDGFTQMGVPLPMISAPLVAGLEFFGGLALIVGLLTRLTALGLAIDMLGAISFVHISNGFFAPKGYEFVLMLMAASLSLALAGPGAYSIDELLARKK